MKIQMVDLQAQYLRIKNEVDEAMQRVVLSTAFINGPEVAEFAHQLSIFLGGSHVIPCANGTDALQIAMMALDLQPGDEVILPVHTYVATAEAVALLKLKPVFVDVDHRNFNIDLAEVRRKISSRTRAIVPVHLYGQCADMEPLLALADKHSLLVIEDAAQSLGSEYRFSDGTWRKAGTMGTVGTTSFFPSKNLGCFGDGGAVITNIELLAPSMKMIANHGQRVKYYHERIGVNSRLDTLQAAVLLVKLKYLAEYIEKRNRVASYYDSELKDIKSVIVPHRVANSTHGFHQYTLQVERRDELKKFLEAKGIPTMIYYPVPLHLQKAYRLDGFGEGSFPVAEALSKTVISLPIHTEMKNEEMEFIVSQIKQFYR